MLDQAALKKALRYNPETGEFFRFIKASRGTPHWKRAWSKKPNGYCLVFVCGKRYEAHRLAWLYVYGRWPEQVIDHINRDPSDNRICNLREATWTQNRINTELPRNNTSGYRGVYWVGDRNKWAARIKLKGRLLSLGYYSRKEDAVRRRKKEEKKLYGEFVA